jgi:YjbE family integral membrane protein
MSLRREPNPLADVEPHRGPRPACIAGGDVLTHPRSAFGATVFDSYSSYIIPILQIIWIDLLLSGDNAVVIALACRALPPTQRKIGIILGAGAAVGLRVAFTGVTSTLIGIPWLKLVSGLLLFWVAVKLLVQEDEGEAHANVQAQDRLWKAVWTIVVADVVMSLDNVIAITAAAKGSWGLIIFGLVLSIPLVIFGSQLILKLIERFPIIVWAGAALLGWIAGEIMIDDIALPETIRKTYHYVAPVVGVAFVLAMGWWMRRKAAREEGFQRES